MKKDKLYKNKKVKKLKNKNKKVLNFLELRIKQEKILLMIYRNKKQNKFEENW